MKPFDVFLSHNSVDKLWVIQLKKDLEQYNVKVWLDRDEIRPGDLFAEALEKGLGSCRAVALIISPEALASGWVRNEYYRALSLAAENQLQLIPVLLRSANLPGFLEFRKWVDFREESTYADSVWRLVWGITGEKPQEMLVLESPDLSPTERPFQAPSVPINFVNRPDVIEQLKNRLLLNQNSTTGEMSIIVINGPGGYGKTTIATVVAHDGEIQRRFFDGVLWATLGQEPDVLSLLDGWVKSLGDFNFHPASIKVTINHLRNLLQEKTILIMVDDVWQSDDLAQLSVGGPRCSLLATTRKPEISKAIGTEFDLDLDNMTEFQSLTLMELWSRKFAQEDMSAAIKIAKELDYAPLALKLAGATIRRLGSWSDFLKLL